MATSPKAEGKCVCVCVWGVGVVQTNKHCRAHLFIFRLAENVNMKGQICLCLHICFALLFTAGVQYGRYEIKGLFW